MRACFTLALPALRACLPLPVGEGRGPPAQPVERVRVMPFYFANRTALGPGNPGNFGHIPCASAARLAEVARPSLRSYIQ